MLIPALYIAGQRLTYLELTSDDPRDVARRMVNNLAQQHQWSEDDRERALSAIDRADPPGLNSWASGPEWWEAIADELRADYRPAWRPAVELADEGARGWQRLTAGQQLAELGQDLRDDADELVGAAGEVASLGGAAVKATGRGAKAARRVVENTSGGGLIGGLLALLALGAAYRLTR